ncbi:hypothetical protein N7495_001037 [Penicillium taxi]|uniref:uncharacterized protein n=1 Tax=Penicillium taxi TaxID=168475 RepID=UPI002545A776|nr:uncharacterized protein N7495_001037 [Penicillium taxi]KAJ5908355.1 hypothetical protein N7495_001037 [Penicillium taxi]
MDARSLPDFKVLPLSTIDLDSDLNPASPFRNPITLKASSSWTYCGPLLPLDPNSLPYSFDTWAEATVNGGLVGPLLSFLKFVHHFLAINNLSHYWITIRAERGSHEYDTPRWHTDDLFFSPSPSPSPSQSQSQSQLPRPISISRRSHRTSLSLSQFSFHNAIRLPQRGHSMRRKHLRNKSSGAIVQEKEQIPSGIQVITTSPNPPNWKLITTLLGPGTIFIPHETSNFARAINSKAKRKARNQNAEHTCLSVRCIGCATAAESVRAHLTTELEYSDTIQAQPGECVFVRVGEDEGAVHSEPMSHGDRIFVNVVPGHEADLKSLMSKWGMDYPRAWCIGLSSQVMERMHCKNFGGL